MSSIEARRLPGGRERFKVRFRHQGTNHGPTFDTLAAAEAFQHIVDSLGPARALALAGTQPTAAPPIGSTRTVAEQVRHHIEHLTDVTDGTRRKYRRIAASRLRGELEVIRVGDLTRDHVAVWVNSQTGSPKTIENARAILSAAMQSAVRDGLAAGNVVKGVRAPKASAEDVEHVYLTREEVGILLGYLPEHYRPLAAFLVGTGVRFGEATALQLRHLDLDAAAPSATIRQAWKDTSGGPPVLGPPKTSRSRRTIAVPPQYVPLLGIVTRGRRSTDYVFTNTRGNPVRNNVFHESAWQRAMDPFEDATGKRPRVHDLRHTYASWAIRSGTPLPVIQRQMGHESIQTTVDTYGHLVRADLHDLAMTIGAQLPDLPALEG